jgi:hypothetical protein
MRKPKKRLGTSPRGLHRFETNKGFYGVKIIAVGANRYQAFAYARFAFRNFSERSSANLAAAAL